MKTLYIRTEQLKNQASSNYWETRILAELEYALRLSVVNEHKYDKEIADALEFLEKEMKHSGGISKEAVLEAERMMSPICEEAKSYQVICASHSHIDLNFLWGYDETVSVVLNTFRTMLNLLKEYPEFIYSQDQAAAYRIVEEYDPEMLEEIKQRVKEGRWELTASSWVEPDKNMPSGESLTRHILYTKKYLQSIFGVDAEDLKIDFEPDTFGHNANIPEILSNGGVKYYYYCRGHNDGGNPVFKWMSPSGKYIIAYKEPHWYDSRIEPSMVLSVPEFCKKIGLKTMLKVYGVGDHGGGPTRRDVERIRDMAEWPVFPSIRTGKYSEYFAMLHEIEDKLPVIKEELNFIFTGCYTSQSKIKIANRVSERLLNEAELFSSAAALNVSSVYNAGDFEKAWRNTLFNQFHDILPGSCVPEVRDFALGRFQEITAMANSKKAGALRKIAENIDTSRYMDENEDISDTISEGAGAGVGVHLFRTGECERGSGKTRVFHVFNPSFHERTEVTEITLWDWNGNVNNIVFKDDRGEKVEHQLVDKGFSEHWGHYFLRVLIRTRVPACGYSTYIMTEDDERRLEDVNPHHRDYPLALENLPPSEQFNFIMENNKIRVEFDTADLSIKSIIDKESGEEMVDAARSGGIFRLIEEDAYQHGGNAWVIGRYKSMVSLNANVKLEKSLLNPNALRQFIVYAIETGNSQLKVTVYLDKDSTRLNFVVEGMWNEMGRKGDATPQLSFFLPLGYKCSSYRYDIPFGTINRPALNCDVPANNWALAERDAGGSKALMLMSGSTYGFRGDGNALSLTLIRSTFSPDPYPESGMHRFEFALCLADSSRNKELTDISYDYAHPLEYVSVKAHEGCLPETKSFMQLEEGNVAISAVKVPEAENDGKRLIIRAYETDGGSGKAVLNLHRPVKNAWFVDANENMLESDAFIYTDATRVVFQLRPYGVLNICVEFH
jgi:alpha-mannosidase